jgi:hypothetical protein
MVGASAILRRVHAVECNVGVALRCLFRGLALRDFSGTGMRTFIEYDFSTRADAPMIRLPLVEVCLSAKPDPKGQSWSEVPTVCAGITTWDECSFQSPPDI